MTPVTHPYPLRRKPPAIANVARSLVDGDGCWTCHRTAIFAVRPQRCQSLGPCRLGTPLADPGGMFVCPNRLVAAATWLVVILVGCTDRETDDGSIGGDGKADEAAELTLTLSSSGGVMRAKETPRFSGAPPTSRKFTCATEGRTPDGFRLICERGQEQLRLTYGPGDGFGAGIYVKSSAFPDKRAYYHCAGSATASDQWPAELQCSATTPRTVIDGQLVSPFSPSLAGVGIFNAHHVATETSSGAQLLRGMKPFRPEDFDDLQQLDVNAVLIFKRATEANEVAEEIDALASIGVPAEQIVNVPFNWKNFPNFEEPCRMTVQSLKLLKEWTASGKTSFVHCTVGEDRTGHLAGLYRLLTETTPIQTIFEQELCERGYSAGNPQKPLARVVSEVDSDLTPVFLKMAFKIATGELTESSLDEAVCDTDPGSDPAFADPQWDPASFRCSISTRYRL
jgi:hypothetical protein